SQKLLPNILADIVRSVAFPKRMRWRGPGLSFARPIRWIVALFDTKTIELELNGIRSGAVTFGHPFLSGRRVTIKRADFTFYRDLLRREKVIVDADERKSMLREGIGEIMRSYGSELKEEELLEEVNNLVEYPFPVECTFPEEFLRVPQEVVETVMIDHQRYFPIEDNNGRLLAKFIAVTNRGERGARLAVEGNERVLKARLADAKFFWEEDRKRSLKDRLDGLKDVVFHEKLGSYWERMERIDRLSTYLALRLNLTDKGREALHQAAHLCKADLLTQMVTEFPKLQGTMGYHYAREEGVPEGVALAIMEHYMPRYAGDKLPQTQLGTILSLADKFDALCACFSVGLVPTGSQDPYGLRRQAQGIVRILESQRLTLSLQDTLAAALENFPGKGAAVKEITAFFRDRLYQTFLERGYRYDIINAVLGAGFDNISDFSDRAGIISKISETDAWQELVTVVERTFNIGKSAPSAGEVDEGLLQQEEERSLWEVYVRNKDRVTSLIDDKKYEEASRVFTDTFAKPVHTFFDKVFVNVEDERLRNNRLVLVKNINQLYAPKVADLSQIVPPVEGAK
ncbi:MAG: glycine--tRNA ligase subunit beta, partial [Candidatus Brocadiales bacterium]